MKKRNEQMQHVQEMLAEREVVAELEGAAHRSTRAVFCCDDKLRSHWQFLPMAQNDRASKKTAKGGELSERRPHPPMLHTGGNFGCTAFVFALYRLIETSKLDSRVERIIRQTDGGGDSVSWVTHALHYMLVREGVFDQLVWIRLKPGHSHNKQV
eukprot:6191729-Pleurochrysis_carterae.AAC.4